MSGRDSRVDERAVAECLPLHPLEARILVVLAERPAHGYRIVQEIEARDADWAKVFPANLYRRIRTLSRRGLIREVDEPDAARGRKSFELTELGEAVARAEAARLHDLLAHFDANDLLPHQKRR